ncbi:MAG: hypothetical protein ACD_3C00083G0023 [uncultured bacterium (gcode 4)]|uniref:Uncharacterized protein n=1 Tax=uncultured bacterium (gcode 4) TaxID=1234023 RepID=K2GDF8_9BACT|nr:MAG: hypothetical protein ACD_3C00083G0023 [uncultured bacterium (gcode 4)]
MQPLPIILIHKWYQSYLEYSILQAKKFNAESEIYLIWDSANKFLWNKLWVKHLLISDFEESIQDINKSYKHLSGNSYQYELFCFQRWFILRDFANKNNYDKFIYIDSDILLYTNVSDEIIRFNKIMDFDLAYVWSSWHTSYFNNQQSISDFCEFILDYYKDNKKLDYLERFFSEYSKIQTTWWVSDMYLFWIYKSVNPKIFNISEIIWWSIYDANFNSTLGNYDFGSLFPDFFKDFDFNPVTFKPFLNSKKIILKNWHVYWFLHWTKEVAIKFNTLHLQGFSKSYMRYFYNEQFIRLKINIFIHYIIEIIYSNSKIIRYLRKSYKHIYEKIIFKGI